MTLRSKLRGIFNVYDESKVTASSGVQEMKKNTSFLYKNKVFSLFFVLNPSQTNKKIICGV